MKGTINLEITTPKIKYELSLERNITVIKDRGATGKSYLCFLLESWEEDRANNRDSDIGVKLNSNAVPVVMTAVRWRDWQSRASSDTPHIIFVDEDTEILNFDFMDYLGKSGDYCVIMSRDAIKLQNFTPSIGSVKSLSGTTVKRLVPYISDTQEFGLDL